MWELLFAPSTKSFSFDVVELARENELDAHLIVHLQGASDFTAEPDHHVRLFVNGHLVADVSGDGQRARSIEAPLPRFVAGG